MKEADVVVIQSDETMRRRLVQAQNALKMQTQVIEDIERRCMAAERRLQYFEDGMRRLLAGVKDA